MHVLALVVVAVLAIAVLGRLVSGVRNRPFVPDPNNKTTITVRGWTRAELERILDDFVKMYEISRSGLVVSQGSNEGLTISFPGDIEPTNFLFLVNYIAYPKDLDLTNRTICALGRVVLREGYKVLDEAMIGREARVYVPTDDTDFDLVYGRVGDETYRISFTSMKWKPVQDARTPPGIADL